MDEGRIDQSGTAREIFDEPATPYVAEFMGGWNVFSGEVRGVENGTADVRTETGETISMTAASLEKGEHVDFSVRRDRVGVARANGASETLVNGVTAVVHGIEYQGTWVKVTMARDSGAGMLVANIQEADFFSDPVAVGDPVKANWTEKDIRILSR
jgi:ABC-type Fe3+/spermidine/putrescine transport system ATPase subunit